VGGPGNGKSEALKEFAEVLNISLPSKITGQPAQRVVPSGWPPAAAFVVPDMEIVFINDASIPHPVSLTQGQLGSLFVDLREAVDRLLSQGKPIALFGNINRGILIEEQEALKGNHPSLFSVAGRLVDQIIRWLANPPTYGTVSQVLADVQTRVPLDASSPYYGQFHIPLTKHGANHDIIVHTVFLDALSLLEPVPGAQGKSIDFSSEPSSVAPYRTLGGLSDTALPRDQTIAGSLFSSLAEEGLWDKGGCIHPVDKTLCDAFDLCPFAQNARWIRQRNLQERFLDTLRVAEIAAARRLTYRDLMGHAALAILGQPEAHWLEGTEPCHWVASRTRDLDDVKKEDDAIVDLVSHRIYMNLFPTTDRGAWRQARATSQVKNTVYSAVARRLLVTSEAPRIRAFEQAFNGIDPSRDVEPWDKGVRAKILDIVESLDVEYATDQLARESIVPSEALTRVEREIHSALRDEIINDLSSGTKEGGPRAALTRSRFLRKWSSTLLLRQVGLALGHVSFKPAFRAWLAEQENALKGEAPLELGQGVQALILPSAHANKFVLAPLRPRTYSLTGELPANTLLVEVPLSDLRVNIVSRGDVLLAEVQVISARKPPETIASLVIDLAVAREALLHTSGTTTSFTEIGNSAFARIERARASLIGSDRMKHATVYFTDEVGKRYRISSAPGPGQLRVISI